MALQLGQIQPLLSPHLEQGWWPRPADRQLTCVSLIGNRAELEECSPGELVFFQPVGRNGVVDRSGYDGSDPAGWVETAAARGICGALLPATGLWGDDLQRLREVGARHHILVGLLRSDTDPRRVANALSRTLAASRNEPFVALLHGADTLQSLAETLGHLLGNSVTIETPGHELLAFSAMQGPVDRVREETILRRRGQPEALAWAIREGHVSAIRKSGRPVRVPPNPEIGFSGRLAMRVSAEGEVLAIIWVADTNRPLNERDEAVMRQAAEAAAAILLQQREAAQKEAELRTEILEDIVHGRISTPESIRALARGLGWDIDRLQQALVITIDRLEELRLQHARQSGRRLQRVRERLAEIVRLETLAVDPEAVIGPRQSGVIVLFAAGEQAAGRSQADEDARKAAALRLAGNIVKRVASLIPELTVTVGVGRAFSSFLEIAESVREAELAARLGTSLWGGNRAVHYSDLGIHRTLFLLQEHEEMITPALQRILDHDARYHSDYTRTLEAYFACMGRLRPAAERLAIHRNTLEYRLHRIEELAGVSLDDPNNRLALELSLKLLELKRTTNLPV
jgi:DNA-binding PucR family transcriptional regulator